MIKLLDIEINTFMRSRNATMSRDIHLMSRLRVQGLGSDHASEQTVVDHFQTVTCDGVDF